MLANNGLHGTIPEEISGLSSSLTVLSLSDNDLTGSVPELLSKLTHLTYLDLSENQLSSTISYSFRNLVQLVTINISHNQLGGRFVSLVSSTLPNLKVLNVSHNPNFDKDELAAGGGTRFSSSTRPSSIEILDISSCGYKSQLSPRFILWKFQNVTELYASNNEFVGFLPQPSMFDNTNDYYNKLEVLVLSNNSFVGPIPWETFDIQTLRILDLSNNSLTGDIPRDNKIHEYTNIDKILGQYKQLEYLDISNNGDMNGYLPEESIGQLSNLKYFNIGGNAFSGTIPTTFGLLKDLKVLDVSNNYLDSTIPIELSYCTNLQRLIVHENKMFGTIPTELSNLSNLHYISLYDTELYGDVEFLCNNNEDNNNGGHQDDFMFKTNSMQILADCAPGDAGVQPEIQCTSSPSCCTCYKSHDTGN